MRWLVVVGAASACLVALLPDVDAASAAIAAPGVRVGFNDRAFMDHVITSTDPPPSCSSNALTVRFAAAATLGECDLVEPGSDWWGVSYRDPVYGPVAGPCYTYASASACDPYEVPRAEWESVSMTCTPGCTSTATSAKTVARWDPNDGRPRGTLEVVHEAKPAPDGRFVQFDITARNPSATASVTDIHYRRVTAYIGDLYEPPGASCSGAACTARGTYSRVSLDGVGDPPKALVCSSNGGWTGPAPQPTDCLARYPNMRNGSGQVYCSDSGTALPAPVPGPGSTTAPPLGDWDVFPSPWRSCAQGTLWEFDLGSLAPGESRSFRMYVGAVRGGYGDAVDALTAPAMGADFWSISEPDSLSPRDTWATLAIGFRGLHPPVPEFTWSAPSPPWASMLPSPYVPGLTICLGDDGAFTGTVLQGSWPAAVSTWSWGDGSQTVVTPGPGAPAHGFSEPGTYTVRLDVKDDHGFTGSVQHDVLVMDCEKPVVPNVCPAFAPMKGGLLFPGEAFILVVQATDGDVDWQGIPTPDPLKLRLLVEPSWPPGLELEETGDGQATVTWWPQPGTSGPHKLIFEALDEACITRASIVVKVVSPLPATADTDQDGIADDQDNCPSVPNRSQDDRDLDGLGDACSGLATSTAPAPAIVVHRLKAGDHDDDGVGDAVDLCFDVPDPEQADTDADGAGDACDHDLDGDGVAQWGVDAYLDNCPALGNPDQEDADGDGVGDACTPVVIAAAATPGPGAAPRAQAPSRAAAAGALVTPLALAASLWAATRRRRAGP